MMIDEDVVSVIGTGTRVEAGQRSRKNQLLKSLFL
jgi:hypothetical protein